MTADRAPLVVGEVEYAWHEIALGESASAGWAHHGIAVLPDGDVVAAAPDKASLVRFDTSGRQQSRVDTELTEMHGIRASADAARRLWVAEHHGMPAVASSSPPVLIAHLAAATSSLRVGSGGVMLPNHAPLVVAEQFGTLEALHPGRIDLGLGRAPGTDPVTARALRRRADLDADTFPDDVVELVGYLIDADPVPGRPVSVPGRGYLPEVWLLGSSLYSAQLAGILGLPFSFAYHFSPKLLDPALATYRASFQPSVLLGAPRTMVAVSVLCAPEATEARWLSGPSALAILQMHQGRRGPLVTPEEAAAYPFTTAETELVESVMATHVIGDPEAVVLGLADLVARTGADELMVSTRAHSLDVRARSLALVAQQWGQSEQPRQDQERQGGPTGAPHGPGTAGGRGRSGSGNTPGRTGDLPEGTSRATSEGATAHVTTR